MVHVSIVCLIYKSTRWLQFVYDQVKKHTINQDQNHDIEFYFVANDASPEVLEYLVQHNIPHYVHNNTEEQRQEHYIKNVYRAYNAGGYLAKGKYIMFINSDMAFSEGWLDKLLKNITPSTVLVSRLVERGVMRSGLYGIERNFGNVPADYSDENFNSYVKQIEENKLYKGGLYMPLLIDKKHFTQVGGYPEGNIVPNSDIFFPVYSVPGQPCISGDAVFIEKLRTIGVEHWTHFGSIVYHFQEGEKRDTV